MTLSFAGGQDTNVQPDALVLYEQLRTLAGELVTDFGIGHGQSYGLRVEPASQKTVAENLIMNALKKRGATVRLNVDTEIPRDSVLSVVVLVHEAKRRDLEGGFLVKEFETVLDARIETRSGQIPIQKVYRGFSADTLKAEGWQENASLFERLLEPAIVIGGAILVVFLLFTVRSS